MPTRLIIVRHAQSEANAEGRIQGHLDVALSELGLRQSACLAERLADLRVDAIYSSPFRRTKQTADVVADKVGSQVQTLLGLRERDVGVLQGLNRQEIIEKFPEYGQHGADVRRIKVEGFEQDQVLVPRVTGAFREILGTNRDRTVAVITHGGVIGTVLRWLLEMPRVRPGPFAIENCSITIFDVREYAADGERPTAQLIVLNDTCHLDRLEPG
jgi:broad specificity phosphatase PhoE